MTKTRLTIAAILALFVARLYRLGNEPDTITVHPASPSVSFENYLEERDEEQRRWDEEEGL